MYHTKSPKLEELYAKSYSLDNQHNERKFENTQSESTIADHLISKIVLMKRHMNFLKTQIERERNLLKQEKFAIYTAALKSGEISSASLPNYSIHQSAAFLDQTTPKFETFTERPDDRSLTLPSKQHLRDIEQKCDTELVKLQKYIEHINEMKLHWKYLWAQHKSINELGDYQPTNRSEKSNRMYEGVPSEDYMDDGTDSDTDIF